jgi:hypothetical protein
MIFQHADRAYEELFGSPVEDPVQIHSVAIIGGYSAYVSMTMIMLSFFQPSNNARKAVLIGFALLQATNIMTQYRFPVREDSPPETILEMPIPILLGLMILALVGALLSQTDWQKRESIRAKQRAQSKMMVYAKQGAKTEKKGK